MAPRGAPRKSIFVHFWVPKMECPRFPISGLCKGPAGSQQKKIIVSLFEVAKRSVSAPAGTLETRMGPGRDGTPSHPGWDLGGPRILPRLASGQHPQRQ